MSETVKSFIFALIGAFVVFVGVAVDAGWEIITFGLMIVLFATICIIMDCHKNKK